MRACSLFGLRYGRLYGRPQNTFLIALLNDNTQPVNINADDLIKHFPVDSKKEGLRKLHATAAESKKIMLMDRLHLDQCQQEKFLPNGVDVRLRYYRAKTQFYMMTAAESSGKVVIQSFVL